VVVSQRVTVLERRKLGRNEGFVVRAAFATRDASYALIQLNHVSTVHRLIRVRTDVQQIPLASATDLGNGMA
jgi:hypothetical protein